MDSVAAVLAVLSKLQSLGFCADLRIPDAAAASDPSEAFDAVLAAFLREAYLGGREARPIPAALGDGRCVDLLRLFLAVRAAGGYAGVTSSTGGWAAAAQSAGVDAALAAPVKLLYAKYFGALDRWIQRLEEAHGPFLDGDRRKRQELFDGPNGVNCDEREQRHVMLKRKRGDMVGMLGWVREIAENAGDGGAVAAGSVDEYFSMALAVRTAVTTKRVRRASMLNGSLFQEIFPRACNCCMNPTSVGICANENLLNGHENNLAGQGKHGTMMQRNYSDGWLFTSQQKNEIPVGPDYQAQVPQWTGEVPVNYDDPETLKWLGTKVWPPVNENCKALFCSDPIGKGREILCGCNHPGSVECVRFHVAERRLKLKCELGLAFYAWGFDRMGEETALSWTDEEEASFKAVVQRNAPSSGRNFWNRLHLFFQLKGRKELVSYYFNCFLLRRRCYQNRITPKNIDSDDEEETEFRFLGNRLGHNAAKYHNTKHTICIENTHSMDLDE
ncbi:AT-rich interactive domain-containing protein 2 [Dichanthelium oligosanthes]|uniref:AT-rich interactive domain-containing protein 2 n=1 Tax=Dichanthelium oligosanthes TaxID=888268 RepID=A0A1E5UVG7_9POAL|nr:AT-rich interactive domain-containing protein 2 [Dichanthelium oligosanthes]